MIDPSLTLYFLTSSYQSFKTQTRSKICSSLFYFDDCERRGLEEWNPSDQQDPWIMSQSEEKQLAMEHLLGYSPEKAAQLNDAEVEEETLQWALDTHVLNYVDEEEDEEEAVASNKYDSISDLIVARTKSVAESLGLLWSVLGKLLSAKEQGVYLITFSKCAPLWNYDTMVKMLQALQICKPLLPFDIKLDLFHPRYKNSPKMWSPETHAPFPTVGIQLVPFQQEQQEMDMDAARQKLESLFGSIDAVGVDKPAPHVQWSPSVREILQTSQEWVKTHQKLLKDDMEWIVQSGREPHHLYETLWKTGSQLAPETNGAMIVVPSLDPHTTHRVAVTFNAALQKLDLPVRIQHVFYPKEEDNHKGPSPYSMIHLVHIT